jgi:transcriptional regulator with XRE-family HTH domain
MYVKLTIPERLKDLRVERGLTLEQLADATGLSRSALGSYEADDYKDISPYSIVTLAAFYGVSTDYLLGVTEIKNHPDTDIAGLHLSDDMLKLLASGKINNRLLCEIATHKDFQRLMVDTEIYVDRIAAMRVHDLNAVLAETRRMVMEKHDPGENDLYMRTLELAQVDEDEYFSRVVHDDLDRIIRDIREAHKKDATTADAVNPSDTAKQALEEALRYKGSADERQARIFCRQLGINYDKLSKDEFAGLIRILKKSSLLKVPPNKRGKVKKEWQRTIETKKN